LTLGIFGAQTLPWPEYREPLEIAIMGARCAHARPSAVLSRFPDPFNMKIASTRDGMPCGDQTNNRADAAPNPARMISKAVARYFRLRRRRR
jgi:hypothetical protein